MKETIVVVDDEKEIADLVEVYLKNEGYRVKTFYHASEAMDYIRAEPVQLAVIDVMMPDIDGFKMCHIIRKTHHFPIIMLTAKVGDMDKITGLSIGADDYVTKPFEPLELVARVKAQLRRFTRYNQGAKENQDEIEIGPLFMNQRTHECTLSGAKVSLTPTEFSILWILCKNKGEVISSEKLFEQVWGEKYLENNNTVMVHIRHIRGKLGGTKLIKTVWGVGYKVEI